MTGGLTLPERDCASVSAIVGRARSTLDAAKSSAEVIEAIEVAAFAYDAAKIAARFAACGKLKDRARTLQAEALEIEAAAKGRLADEYDAAQERGEVASVGQPSIVPVGNDKPATAADLGLTRKDIHEARQVRDAEAEDPGIVRRTLDERLAAGREPSKAALRQAVVETISKGYRAPAPDKPKHVRVPDPAWDRFLSVKDACQTLIDIIGQHGPDAVLAGALDSASRKRAAVIFRDGHRHLTQLVEALDA